MTKSIVTIIATTLLTASSLFAHDTWIMVGSPVARGEEGGGSGSGRGGT